MSCPKVDSCEHQDTTIILLSSKLQDQAKGYFAHLRQLYLSLLWTVADDLE